ncbi:MAG: hypothetical protein Q4P36_00695 [Bowdeniella nasicola]|nr:hypothetical protein [Bowdeniella nasicola]
MSQSHAVNQLLPLLVRITAKPGAFLLIASSVVWALFAVMTLALWFRSDSGAVWLPVIVAVILFIAIASFAFFRSRILSGVEELNRRTRTEVIVSQDVAEPRESETSQLSSQLQEEAEILGEAYRESMIRTARFFPRIEAAQRGLVRAAGGLGQAPFLKYDMRLVLASFLLTAAAIPLSILGFITCAFALLF